MKVARVVVLGVAVTAGGLAAVLSIRGSEQALQVASTTQPQLDAVEILKSSSQPEALVLSPQLRALALASRDSDTDARTIETIDVDSRGLTVVRYGISTTMTAK